MNRALVLRIAAGVAAIALLMPTAVTAKSSGPGVTPIVLFPAWHFTRLTVTVMNQTVDPGCPRSGTFEDLVFGDPGPTFSQLCRDELLTLRYDGNTHKPIRLRFHEQPG